MKKRLISAFLALTMLFSLVPTTFAAPNTYDATNGFDTDSPITGLKIVIKSGAVQSIKVKPNTNKHLGNDPMSVAIIANVSYEGDDGEGNPDGTPINDINDVIEADPTTISTTSSIAGMTVFPGYHVIGKIQGLAEYQDLDLSNTDNQYEGVFNVANIATGLQDINGAAYNLTPNDDDYAFDGVYDANTSTRITTDNISELYENLPVRVYVVSGNGESGIEGNRFYYDTTIKLGGDTTINVPADDTPNPTPTQDTTKYVGDVTVSVTDPVVGVAPSASGTASGENAGTSATVAWDTTTNALTPNGKFDANKVYKANVTVNAADDAEFKAGSKVTVNGTAITLTDEMISSDKKRATVEYTPAATDKLKVTSVTASGNLTKNEYKPDESFNAGGLKATITYNNGEQVTDIDVTNNNYGVFAALAENAQDASSDSNGTTLALDSPKNVFIVYNHAEDSTSTDIDATGGLVKSTIADTITVANAKITTAQVSVTYPKPGGTPDTVATVPDGANYTAEVTWEYNGTEVTGNFEYDKAYDAIIKVKPNTGYALDNTNGVALTVKDKTAINPGADKPATIASDDIDVDGSGVKTVSFDATASTPISASISDSFDLYDKNDVNITLTLGTHVIGDITGITIDGQTLSSSDYTISGNIITVKGASLATKLTGLTSTAANKNVEITVTGQQNATTATLSAIDTTPYITITDPTQGAITGVTHTSGTKVALTKNTAYTLSAPTVAHTTGYTWTVNGITGTDNGQTYTFTPTGGEDITATVALTVDAGHKLTINKTGNGTVTVAKDGGSTLTAETDGTYTVYSDERYTVTATADDQYKVTAVTGETISGVQKTVTHSVANPSADTTVEVTFAEKTAPTVSADMTYRKGANDGNKAFTITLGDYSDVTVSGTPSGTLSTDKATYTVSSTDLDSATNGDHTYTFNFGEGKTLTAKITVLAARSITSVTAPTGTFAHGDTFKLDGLAFTVKEGETSTTYSYNGTSWDNTLPTGTQFSLDGTNFSEWDAFKTAAEAKITRHDTTDSTAVNNGTQITVSLGTATKASNSITVGQKAITVNPSQTTGINKDYDGKVTAPALTATIPDGELVGDDAVTASVTAVYRDGVAAGLTDQNASETDKNVVFTPTLDGANKDNYTIKAIPNGSGKINKRTIKIAIINNVPAATKNKADTQIGNATATIPTNTEYDHNTLYEVVDGETVAITYDYSYANISSVGRVSDVTITNIATTNTNYTVEPTCLENQNGTVNNRTIKSITISDPTKNEYNYSDTFDPTGIKVTVTYDGETDPVVYAWNAVPDDITLKWTGTEETLSATHKFDSVGTYTITASAAGVDSATTNDITVAKLFVNVVVSGNITKVYNGDGDLDDDDADGITYTVTNASDGYEDQFNADNVTVSSQSVTYKDSLVGNVGVWISNCESDNPNYKVSSVKNQVNATITKRPITVTAITVPTVKQYSNDTDVPANNVGTSAVTFDNVVSGENVTVDYKYTYNDTSVAGDTSNITINNLVLNSTNTVNKNYTLDESTPTKSGHVDEREVGSLTVTAPTQFATAQTYGTALALAGLKVQVNFTSGGTSDGSETYVWNGASTWTKQVEGQSDVDVTTVPFTLAWSGTTDVPTQGETLNVQRSTKGITASYTGTSVTGTSDQITVNPITLTKIEITGDDVTKVYEGNKTLTNPAFTYAITEGIINSDTVTVEPTTVEYAEADVHTSKPLNITGFHLTSDNNGNYTLGTPDVTGTPNGTITKRPITLTAITNIPAINRFEAGTGTDKTATSATNGGATFEAASTDTGIVSGETVTVIYDYAYEDNQTVSNSAAVTLSNVRLYTASDKNYSLTNNATATGVVNEVEATGVTVTIPDKTYEYGDKLDLTGTTVTVDYGNTNTEVYTSDDGVNWKKNNTAVSEKPFTITLPTDKDSLAVGTATVSVKVKDGVEDSVSRTVNKRKVTVTPSKNGDVTKVYNGNTTYTNGVIEWTVGSVNSIEGLSVTLPTVSSATYTYNDSTVALANKITVSAPTLSDTNNFEISDYTAQDFDAKITLRPLVITGITIPDVNKYADVSQEVTDQTATSAANGGATFEATGTDTGIVSGETVGVTFNYKYVTSNPESGTTTDVDITSIALDNSVGTSANYSLTPNSLTGSANVVERAIDSITVANPTQFNSDVTYNDKLSIAGLKVTINYTDRTSEVYTATVVNDVVSWALGSVNISEDNIPFTLSWKDTANGGTFAQGQTLSVTGHNGNQIVANHKNGNDSGEGSAVTIKPIAITSITAAKSGDITKTYNGDTELNGASKSNIGYTSTQVISGDTVTLGATPAYENKNVGQNKAISFTTPTVSGNDNYTLGTGATVTGDVVGDITVKTVAISNVYIPSIYKDTEDLVKSISNASAIASGKPTANTVVAADILSGDRANLTFAYKLTYANSTDANPTVTISDTSVTGTESGNYEFTWPTGLTGTVVADEFTDAAITSPDLMQYTHGDTFNPTGLSVTIKTSSHPTGTTYTVTGTEGNYKWDTDFPAGVNVSLGSISLNSNDALNFKAHYKNMKDQKIKVSAGEKEAETGAVTMLQKQLTATASISTENKVYDSKTALREGQTVTYTIGTGEVQNFNSVTDDVKVTADAKYKSADVSKTGETINNVGIEFTNIALSGNDAANYIVPSSIADIAGMIIPYPIHIRAINENAPTAYYKIDKSGTIDSTVDYTAEMNGLTKPAIKFSYNYGELVNTVASSVNVPISSIDFVIATDNFVIGDTPSTINGKVEVQGIKKITITKDNHDYKYGDTLVLNDLSVTVTYDDDSTKENIKYNDTDWQTLGLTLNTTLPTDGTTILKNSTDNGKTITVEKDTVNSNAITINVAKRTVKIERDGSDAITKTYDGTPAVEQTIALKVADSQTGYDGVYNNDITGVTPPTYIYSSKDAQDNIALTGTPTLVGSNLDEYTPTYPSLTGNITTKSVTLTPVISEDIYENKFATDDKVITKTNATVADGNVTQSGIVSGEEGKFTFTYTVTVPKADLASAATKSYAPTGTNVNGTGKGNYTFTWNDASVEIKTNAATSMAVTTDPTDISYQKYYGDSISLDGMVVTITYGNGSTHEFTYDSAEWNNEGFTVAIEDGGDFSKLVTGNNGKHIVVSKTGLDSANTTATLKVNKKDLHLTAEKADGLSAIEKTYDTTTNAKSILKFGITSTDLVSGDSSITVDSSNVSATFDNKNQGSDKDITISGLTITGDNSDQYNVIMPSGVKGTINPKSITVKVAGVADILAGVSGEDLKKTASINYSEQPESGVSVTVTATYPDSTQDPVGQKTEKTLTFTKTETGNELGNYVFTLDENGVKGYVVSNIINEINVTTPPQTEYTHGDNLSLKGMVIEVKYQDSRDDNIYTCQADGTWKDKNSITVTELPVSFALEKNGTENALTSQTQQLRRDTNDGAILVVKGGDESNKDTTLTVNKKEITQIIIPTTLSPEKTYDGTTTVTQFISYEGVGVLDADKVTVKELIRATANYDNKDVAFDSDGTTVASKAINFTNPTMTENDNYTMSSSATVTTTITGKIKPKDLTVTITSVPSIIVGQNKIVTLTKTTNYTQSGEVTVGENTEEVNLTVEGKYEQNTTAAENVNVTYSVKNKDSYKNYNITVTGNPTGTVNKKPVTKIEVTSPEKTTWSHGDDLTLNGMTITVTYNNDDTDKKQYKHMDGKWHDVTGGSDAELSGTPDDVIITWGDTDNSATDGVIRLDDGNKGLTGDGNKTTSVKVTSTVKDTNGEYQSASTGDITLTKKQLTLTVSGNVEKPYDKTNNLISGNNVTLTLAGVAGTDGVALNETATKNNIKYAGTTVEDTASSPNLVIGTIVLNDSANNQYYTLPSGASITNSTTGKINKRPVKVISVTKNMDTTVDSPKTGTLEKLVQSSTGGYVISGDAGFYSILDGHTIMVDIPYEYGDTSSEGTTTVTYNNTTANVSDENADYVANYKVSFDIPVDENVTISNGTVTGVKIETTGKTEYTHGDSFDLAGTKITVTYNNGAKQDTYEYDTASGKWIKNGTGTPAKLPDEIGISLGNTNPTINANPASDTDKTVVKYDEKNTTPELKATYEKSGSEPIPSTENPTVTLKKKTITITVDNNGTDAINHTYSGNNSLTADEIGKLAISEPADFKVGSDDVTLTKGTLSATIGSNTNGNVANDLTINATGYVLGGADADNYEISYANNAKGNIVKAPLTITISSVPSIIVGQSKKVTLTKATNYTQSGEVTVGEDTEEVILNVEGEYEQNTTAAENVNVSYTVTNENEYPNYDITIIGSPKGTVTQKTATVEIINQPKFVTDTTRPQHGDKLGANGLNGFEYTVSYSDGTTTKHKYENGDWLTTGGYTKPEDGTVFKWTNTDTPVSSDSEIRRDKDNQIKITVPTATNEAFTNEATADKKKVKITANGTYTKVYDGTNAVTLNETTPEITYTVSDVATGDTVTVTATPAFVDENVAKFGDVYQKAINFTNVSISNTDNYEIKADENENNITPIMGAITPKTINITELTVPSSTKGSAGEKTVTKNKNFTTTDILEKDKDNVTIGYKATFVTSATGTVDATVTDAKVDGSTEQMTLNYVIGTVTNAKIDITSGGSSGGGGGGGNSLSIKYENADGTAGKDVSKIEAPVGSDPVDLIAVFTTKPKDPTVIWTSDNESVATVDENGIVKFIGEGTAIITAQSKTNKTLKDTVTVTVTKAVATPTPKPANPTLEPTKEPSIITKTMLNPYIVGYDDNVFGPELPISREEVSAIFARLIANNIYMDKEYDTSFPDVGEGWSKDYIGYLEKFSVVTGYEDGTFRPQNYITRAEMAVMMAKAEGYDISGYMSSDELAYPDVDEGYSEWAVKAIKYLTDRGIMEGYPDGTFGPNRPITRAETVATVNRVLADMTVGNIEVLPSDMTEAHWAYNDVVFAMNHRILKDVAADESQFIKSEEYDKNKITETEVVEDTSDENDGAGASPTPEPSPTPNA